jgi:hypothetical protein
LTKLDDTKEINKAWYSQQLSSYLADVTNNVSLNVPSVICLIPSTVHSLAKFLTLFQDENLGHNSFTNTFCQTTLVKNVKFLIF